MELSCGVCHQGGFPQLTRFGRLFKLNGCMLSGLPQVVAQIDSSSRRSLELSPIPGLSLMAIVSVTSDARFTDRDVLYGVTLHNNPTVQDVWNTAPAWSYPFVSAVLAPRPAASTLIEGALAQSVLGLGAYALYDNMLYAEVSGYTSAPQGPRALVDSMASNTIRSVSPYWRIALQNRHGPTYLMVGMYGLSADLYPQGASGRPNRYDDVGVDAEVEREVGRGLLVVRASYMHEQQTLAAYYSSAAPAARRVSNALNSFRANAVYKPSRYYAFTLGYFGMSGSSDAKL